MTRIGALDPSVHAVALQLHGVMAMAYAQEALILGMPDPQPMAHSVEDLQASPSSHLGAWVGSELVGALAFGPDDDPGRTLIELLVVHPQHQRRGIARALVRAALQRSAGRDCAVSTTAANLPALALYAEFGFAPYRRGTIGPLAVPLVKLLRPALPVP